MKRFLILPLVLLLGTIAYAAEATSTISIIPETILQGDPVMVTISSTSPPVKILFDNKNIPIFIYKNMPTGLIAIDINLKAGVHEISVLFKDGTKLIQSINILAREKIEEPLGIPQKLGGNTEAAGQSLISNLTKENIILNNLKTGIKAFWTKPFIAPLPTLLVTDRYGYNRKTGEYTIAHKGTDFHAIVGTKVYAMNRGVVRIAKTFIIYGKTIVLDHGFGLNTLYMHLSKIYVNTGELVQRGQLIGLTGATGYAEVPHLHLSIKINGISIDPEVFFKFFNI
jgi:murein DD-endopeptidase MepM/ murein hydrolase activator NlpD